MDTPVKMLAPAPGNRNGSPVLVGHTVGPSDPGAAMPRPPAGIGFSPRSEGPGTPRNQSRRVPRLDARRRLMPGSRTSTGPGETIPRGRLYGLMSGASSSTSNRAQGSAIADEAIRRIRAALRGREGGRGAICRPEKKKQACRDPPGEGGARSSTNWRAGCMTNCRQSPANIKKIKFAAGHGLIHCMRLTRMKRLRTLISITASSNSNNNTNPPRRANSIGGGGRTVKNYLLRRLADRRPLRRPSPTP